MVCKECGDEIKKENGFCTNCGKKVIVESKEISNDNIVISKKVLTRVFIGILILIVFILLFLLLKKDNNSNAETLNTKMESVTESTDDNITKGTNIAEDNAQDTQLIILGKHYNYSDNTSFSYITFPTEKDFVMQSGENEAGYTGSYGTYEIEGNTITLTTTNYDWLEEGQEFEPVVSTITILEDGTLEYIWGEGNKYVYDINADTIGFFDLEEIFAKYPQYREHQEGFICSGWDQYWLLDEEGKKVYFYDLDSFEEAMKKCPNVP